MNPILRAVLLTQLIAILCTLLLSVETLAKTFEVRSQNDLSNAIAQAIGGDKIFLSEKFIFVITIKGKRFAPALVIQSKEPDKPAVVSKIVIHESSGVSVQNLEVRSSVQTTDTTSNAIRIIKSQKVSINNCKLLGMGKVYLTDANKNQEQAESLMLVRWSKDITISNNLISGFFHGIGILETTDLKIVMNDITGMQGDGIRMGGVQRVEISDNRIHDFLGTDQTITHSDMIQLWSTNAEIISGEIEIARNRLLSGNGPATQSIFMRNEQADQNPETSARFYSNIIVHDNLIHNGHLHGITVGETRNVTILNNTLLPNPLSTMGVGSKRQSMAPMIRVAERSSSVEVLANIVVAVHPDRLNDPSSNYLLSRDKLMLAVQLKRLFNSAELAGILPDSSYLLQSSALARKKRLGSSLTY